MSDKSLKDKAIDIKGKQYVPVAERVLYFNAQHKTGYIETELLPTDDNKIVKVKATVVPEAGTPNRRFTGHSQEQWGDGMVNKTSALENAETSAVGRALAMMGIGVIESIASTDEVNKATAQVHEPSDKQISAIRGYLIQLGVRDREKREEMIAQVTTFQKASATIAELQEKLAAKRQASEEAE